jgi:hypothetical protein
MAFTDWVNVSPQNKATAAQISQLVMKYRLTQASTAQQIFDALKQWTSGHTYDESADNLSAAIQQKKWNCVSLSRLLVVTYCATRDMNPNAPAGIAERRINSRKLSASGIQANIGSLTPNVTRQDLPAERRYTFSGHTYVAIQGTDYDLLMGTHGPQVAARFPVDVTEGPAPARLLQCTIPPHTFRLTPTGARVGPLPGFRLERV